MSPTSCLRSESNLALRKAPAVAVTERRNPSGAVPKRRAGSSTRRPGVLEGVLAPAVLLGALVQPFDQPMGAAVFAQPAEQPGETPADLAVANAKIWTGAAKQAAGTGSPEAPTAVAVAGGRIVAVGNDDQIRGRVAPDTKVIDAKGRRLIPGITDSHTHLINGGFQLVQLNLRNVRSKDEFIQAVAEAVQQSDPADWLLGGRWSVESWADPQPPHRTWIDGVTGDMPAFLTRMDGHQALVNSLALDLARIDAAGPLDPPGGEIERDPRSSKPTGILKESAMELVSRYIPPASAATRQQALLRAMAHANALGVTSVHDMSEADDLAAFRRAHAEGKLTVRITSYLSVDDWLANVELVRGFGIDDDLLRVAGFKGFMDGSLGSRTAYMREPYSDAAPGAPYPRGQLTAMAADREAFTRNVAAIDKEGLQLAVHAIGDEANHLLINAYEAAQQSHEATKPRSHEGAVGSAVRTNADSNRDREEAGKGSHEATEPRSHEGAREARHRIEHAQHLHVADISRVAQLGLVASMQPYHKADDGRYAEKAIGRDRLGGSCAFRQLVDAGALLVFGSDWPVVTMNPFAGIDSAVSARTLDGAVWLPSHSLTLEEALAAYTADPPRAIHRDDRIGTIEVGKLADMVILADDPFTIPPRNVGDVKVDVTIVGGKVVYERSE